MNLMLRYIDGLARRNSEALSFIPLPRLEDYFLRGQILLERENGEPCGYLVHGNHPEVCRIYQACIQYDARRRDHGLALVRRLVLKADRMGCRAVSLWCADDLEANAFWKAAGFTFCGQREGGRRRGRKHNHWVLWLKPPELIL